MSVIAPGAQVNSEHQRSAARSILYRARNPIERFFDSINVGVARPDRINARQTIWRSS
jgi:hypothetical protein